jgi:PKD repeat protein
MIAAGVGDVRGTLAATADDLGTAGRDSLYGYGLVDADEAAGTSAPLPENAPPTASFTWTATDLTASFTDTSTDSDGWIAAWSWSFGDGSTSTSQNPSHTYAASGTYLVTLTVTDNDGATDTDSVSVAVRVSTGGTLHVDVETDKSTYTLGQKVYITVTVTDDGHNRIGGAAVHCEILTPTFRMYAGDATTNSAGQATFGFKTKKPDGTGIYYVEAYASKSGYTPSEPLAIGFTVIP